MAALDFSGFSFLERENFDSPTNEVNNQILSIISNSTVAQNLSQRSIHPFEWICKSTMSIRRSYQTSEDNWDKWDVGEILLFAPISKFEYIPTVFPPIRFFFFKNNIKNMQYFNMKKLTLWMKVSTT